MGEEKKKDKERWGIRVEIDKNNNKYISNNKTGKKMEQTTIENQSDLDSKKLLKYTFDGTGKEDAVETLNKFMKDCNAKDYGKKVTVSDIIARALRKLDQKDMNLLQEQSMGLKDSLRQRYKEEKGKEATEDEFVRWLLNEYSPQKLKKRALQ